MLRFCCFHSLFLYAPPKSIVAASAPPTTFRHVWYFDPVHGKTQAAGGNGSQAAPWNNLQALVQAEAGYTYPLLTTAPYPHAVAAGKPSDHRHRPKRRADRAWR